MDWFASLDDPRAEVGGKAHGLGRLRALGLAVPDGFVVTDAVARALLGTTPVPADPTQLEALADAARAITRSALPDGFEAALLTRARANATPLFSVRSSFGLEDDADAIGAGVFESRIAVPAAALPQAIREVVASAVTPGALAYARARGRDALTPPLAVLVHDYRPAQATGHAALSTADASPALWLRTGTLAEQDQSRVEQTLQNHAPVLLQAFGPCELEWAFTPDDGLTYLQARPYQATRKKSAWHLPGPADEGWRWDAAHNPWPLSPAQQGLVALVEGQGGTGYEQRVVEGYLFYRARPDAVAIPIPSGQAGARYRALAARIAAGRDALGTPPALEPALALFLAHYPGLMAIGQAVRAETAAFAAWLRAQASPHRPDAPERLPDLLAGVPSRASQRQQRLAAVVNAVRADDAGAITRTQDDYLALFGDESSAWDLCEPTLAETPGRVLAAARALASAPLPTAPSPQPLVADALRAALPADLQHDFDIRLATARDAAAVREDDDWLYARLQAPVRAALLALGRRLTTAGAVGTPEDIFFLPLARARALAAAPPPWPDLRADVASARAADKATRATPPPAGLLAPSSPDRVRGHGVGGRAIGRVVQLRPGHTGDAGAVLVATTILPTELPLLAAAALVVETGGPLDHVAAQARERGLPAVVGAAGATATFADGELVLVDGEAGLVQRLAAPR